MRRLSDEQIIAIAKKSGGSSDSYTKAEADAKFATNALLMDNAAKNLFAFTIDDLKSINTEARGYIWTDNSVYDENSELTYTINADEAGRVESIVLSGTADAMTQFAFNVAPTLADKTYPAGDYIASVNPELPEGVYFRLNIPNGFENITSEEVITLAQAAGIGFSIRVMEGTVLENVVFKPMFRRSGTSAGFETSYMTQKQLDAAVRELQMSNGIKGRTVEKIYANTTSTVTPDTVTLSKPYTDFDELVFIAGSYAEGRYYVNNTFTLITKEIEVNENTWYSFYSNYSDVGESRRFAFSTPTTMIYKQADQTPTGAQLNWHVNFVAIYGIKYDSDYITIDSEMSGISTNPVQNKVITEAIDHINWEGTQAQYEALTPAQKVYEMYNITEDEDEEEPVNTASLQSLSPLSLDRDALDDTFDTMDYEPVEEVSKNADTDI